MEANAEIRQQLETTELAKRWLDTSDEDVVKPGRVLLCWQDGEWCLGGRIDTPNLHFYSSKLGDPELIKHIAEVMERRVARAYNLENAEKKTDEKELCKEAFRQMALESDDMVRAAKENYDVTKAMFNRWLDGLVERLGGTAYDLDTFSYTEREAPNATAFRVSDEVSAKVAKEKLPTGITLEVSRISRITFPCSCDCDSCVKCESCDWNRNKSQCRNQKIKTGVVVIVSHVLDFPDVEIAVVSE